MPEILYWLFFTKGRWHVKIILCQHGGIYYAEVAYGRNGARGTGTTEKEAIGDLILGSQSVLGIKIEHEAVIMPPPAEAASGSPPELDHGKISAILGSTYDPFNGRSPTQAYRESRARALHVPVSQSEMAEHAANFSPEELP